MTDVLTAEEAVQRVVRELGENRTGPAVVLIDGRSGSGKSTLADRVMTSAPAVTLLRLDDVYPGWDGLDAAAERLADLVLAPLAGGRPGRWQRWDWASSRPAEWEDVPPDAPLLVEGCGAISRASRARATFAAWVDLETGIRRRRALERDGDVFARNWDRWAAQEARFIEREGPRALADVTIDGRTITG